MEKTNNSKKALVLLTTYMILLFTSKSIIRKNEPSISFNESYIEDNNFPYALCNDKCIYIVDDESLTNNDDNIYVIDDRDKSNPTMSVCDSYKIKNPHEIKAILEVLLTYEKEYSSKWNRTLSSMEKEWIIHNICYFLNYKTYRTDKVDLDNNDEHNYDTLIHILTKNTN